MLIMTPENGYDVMHKTDPWLPQRNISKN